MTYGRLDAINLIDLEMRLKRMNLDLVTGHPIQHKSLFGPRGVPRPELINFCFHLEQLTRAGVPILEGLTDLRDSIEHPRFRSKASRAGKPCRRQWPSTPRCSARCSAT